MGEGLNLLTAIAAFAFGYLAGSIPFGLLLTRAAGLADIRQIGSGNIGATNVLRTGSRTIAAATLSCDILKGTVPVVLFHYWSGEASALLAGLAAIAGHMFPVWLRFRGGKGVATAAGVFGMLTPAALLAACGVFLGAVWITRFISVGSIAAAITLTIVTAVSDSPAIVAAGAAIAAAVIIHRHRANLARILAGTERRVGLRL